MFQQPILVDVSVQEVMIMTLSFSGIKTDILGSRALLGVTVLHYTTLLNRIIQNEHRAAAVLQSPISFSMINCVHLMIC